jgi:hypothetical protein
VIRPLLRVSVVIAAAGLALAACSPKTPPPIVTTTVISTVVPATSRPEPPPTPTFRPTPAADVAVLPDVGSLPAHWVDGACPYLHMRTAMDLEGNRIGRSTISQDRPTSCTFYYAYAPHRATLQVAPAYFATAVDAYNAMVLTGRAGTDVDSRPGIAPGVDAVLYRTRFYAPDGGRNWACSFAKGTTMVTIRTDRTDTSFNAVEIATVVAAHF